MFKMNNYYIGTYEIERAHKGCFFSADSCRFFKSRISGDAWRVGDLAWFVTSEKRDGHPRLYTVRQFDFKSPGNVKTVGEFQQYSSSAQAKKAIEAIIKEKAIIHL